MAAPEIRAIGAINSGVGTINPTVPAGTEAGDLLLMVCESGGTTSETEATTALTATGWSSAPSSPQVKGNTRLTVLYKIAVGSDATTTNDTGDHQIARIVGVKKGTFNETNPFNANAGGTQAATKSVSIPGATTTVAECLVLAFASGHLPKATGTAEFSGESNASLSSLTERIDNTREAGDGGAVYCVSGVKTTAGAYSATTTTAATEAERGVISLAITALAAPLVESKAASGVEKTKATLKGTVNSQAESTTYKFQYGTTEALGTETEAKTAGEGTTAVEKEATVEGLSANTKYFFRISATNATGTTNGTILNFTTEAAAAGPPVGTMAMMGVGR